MVAFVLINDDVYNPSANKTSLTISLAKDRSIRLFKKDADSILAIESHLILIERPHFNSS